MCWQPSGPPEPATPTPRAASGRCQRQRVPTRPSFLRTRSSSDPFEPALIASPRQASPVVRGRAQVVLHDLRDGSPTEGATETFVLDGDDDTGVYIPPGVAHGFAALTDITITYQVDRYFDPADELGVAWDDPDIGAQWDVDDPILSARDQTNPRRKDIPPELRPAATRPAR